MKHLKKLKKGFIVTPVNTARSYVAYGLFEYTNDICCITARLAGFDPECYKEDNKKELLDFSDLHSYRDNSIQLSLWMVVGRLLPDVPLAYLQRALGRCDYTYIITVDDLQKCLDEDVTIESVSGYDTVQGLKDSGNWNSEFLVSLIMDGHYGAYKILKELCKTQEPITWAVARAVAAHGFRVQTIPDEYTKDTVTTIVTTTSGACIVYVIKQRNLRDSTISQYAVRDLDYPAAFTNSKFTVLPRWDGDDDDDTSDTEDTTSSTITAHA